MTHTSTLGKYQQNQLSCISPPAMQSALPGATYSPGSRSNPTWWLNPKDTTGNGHTPFCLLLLLPHRFCVPKLHKWGLVRPVPETWHCLWLQCQRHNQRGQGESECLWPQICCSGALGRNTFRRDWLMLWFNPGGVIAIGGFQHEHFLQMIGSGCSGWNFSSWLYNKIYSLNRKRELSFGVGWSLPGRHGKDVIMCSPAAFLFHDPEDHVHHRILHLPCDAGDRLSGPGLLQVRRSISALCLARIFWSSQLTRILLLTVWAN